MPRLEIGSFEFEVYSTTANTNMLNTITCLLLCKVYIANTRYRKLLATSYRQF
jgi:hypothetical protein